MASKDAYPYTVAHSIVTATNELFSRHKKPLEAIPGGARTNERSIRECIVRTCGLSEGSPEVYVLLEALHQQGDDAAVSIRL